MSNEEVQVKRDEDTGDTIMKKPVRYSRAEPTMQELAADEAVKEREGSIEQSTEEVTDEAEQDINESSQEQPAYTVKVDGSEMDVTLDELLRGYQREADYTRKTSELSLEKSKVNDMMQHRFSNNF